MTPEIAGKIKLARERLRDEFAMAALTLAAAGASHVMDPRTMTPDQVRQTVAAEAYKLADAMLAERDK